MPSVTPNKLLGYSDCQRLRGGNQQPIPQRLRFQPLSAIPLECHFGTHTALTYQRKKLKQL